MSKQKEGCVLFHKMQSSTGLMCPVTTGTLSKWRHTQLFPCPSVTRTPTSRHPNLSRTPAWFPRSLQSHPRKVAVATVGCHVATVFVQTRTATKSSGLSLVFFLFTCLPVSQISRNMLITLFLAFLVSSVIATEKGKLI